MICLGVFWCQTKVSSSLLEFLFATDLILGCGDAELDSEAVAAIEVNSQINFTYITVLMVQGPILQDEATLRRCELINKLGKIFQ